MEAEVAFVKWWRTDLTTAGTCFQITNVHSAASYQARRFFDAAFINNSQLVQTPVYITCRTVQSLPRHIAGVFSWFGNNQTMGIPFGVRLLGIEANLSLLRHLSGRYSHLKGYWAANPSCSPEDVGPSPALGTRPHLVEWLWEHIQRRIPSSRPWVVLGTPVLVNPDSEIVFAFAAGSDYALRLPAQTREAAIAAGAKRSAGTGGATVNLSVIGEEWVFGMGQSDAEEWWHRALEYSASTT